MRTRVSLWLSISCAHCALLWQTPTQSKEWYDRGKEFFAERAPDFDGVTGNLGRLHEPDIADSRRFLLAGEKPLWPEPMFREDARALDVGAGVGRVSGALLADLCGEVDLVDGSAAFLEQARASFAAKEPHEARGRVGTCFCSELQRFVPKPASYDLVWLQWATMYLTCLLYTSPSPRDGLLSRMPSSA